MFKLLFFLLFSLSTLCAKSYDFTELRYSDAIGKFTQLEGKITFKQEGLSIEYPKSKRLLEYDGEDVLFFENEKEVDLPSVQASNMMHYFDILKLLHEGDETELEESFDIKKHDGKTLLSPKGSIKYYIEHIELVKENNALQYVKLFLKNSDYITINIADEIR